MLSTRTYDEVPTRDSEESKSKALELSTQSREARGWGRLMIRALLWISFLALLIAVIYIASRNTVDLEKRLVGSGILALAAFVAWFVYSPNLESVETRFPAFFETDEKGIPTGRVTGLACESYDAQVVQPLAATVLRLRHEGPGSEKDGYWLHWVDHAQVGQAELEEFDTEMWLEFVVFCIQHRIFKLSRPHLNEVSWSAKDGVKQTEALPAIHSLDTEPIVFRDFLTARKNSIVWNSLNLDFGRSELHIPKGLEISIEIEKEKGTGIILLHSKYAEGGIQVMRQITMGGSFVQFEVSCQAEFHADYKMSSQSRLLRQWFEELFESLSEPEGL